MRWTALTLLCVASLGCGEDTTESAAEPLAPPDPLAIPAGCNPIAADWDCLLPWPSDVFRVDGIVSYPDAAQVKDQGGNPLSPLLNPADGSPILPQILVRVPGLPGSAAADQLVFHDQDPALSMDASSPTLILDAETGEAVPHFAELDPTAEDDARRVLVIRPLQRLKDNHRYIVALWRMGEPPEGFRRIRDDDLRQDPVLTPIAERFADALTQLDTWSPRTDLTLAWDFTTRSQASVTEDMRTMTAPTPDISVTIDSVEVDVSDEVLRRVEGHLTVPLWMESDQPGARIHRGADGKPALNGTAQVPFIATIPRSVIEREEPARIIHFGHGFFGDRTEAEGHPARLGQRLHAVVIAIDWWGMSAPDLSPVLEGLLNDPSKLMIFVERVHQGMVNRRALEEAIAGPLLQEAAFQEDGAPVYDAEHLYFYGLSQGHILGGTWLALSERVERGALGAGGAGFTFIMFRSSNFSSFLQLALSQLPDAMDRQKFMMMAQHEFDRMDPITYAPEVQVPVLMQIGVGDPQVPNMAAHVHARALGLSLLEPAPRAIFGLEGVVSPFEGSALAEYEFGVDPLPGHEMVPPTEGNVVHEGVRQLVAAQEQIGAFFWGGGTAQNQCDGVCDPD
ncbi:MAG: hypothetical protein ACI9WU_002020 [Myxococcota bacterium]|jgi:hypothetical protein